MSFLYFLDSQQFNYIQKQLIILCILEIAVVYLLVDMTYYYIF